jgi:hypothetical protein
MDVINLVGSISGITLLLFPWWYYVGRRMMRPRWYQFIWRCTQFIVLYGLWMRAIEITPRWEQNRRERDHTHSYTGQIIHRQSIVLCVHSSGPHPFDQNWVIYDGSSRLGALDVEIVDLCVQNTILHPTLQNRKRIFSSLMYDLSFINRYGNPILQTVP